MRQALFLIATSTLFIFSNHNASAQCQADAGSDTVLCIGIGLASYHLGGNQTASGGVAPYQFTWSCSYTIGTITYTASDFLDDTTAANPQLIDHNANSLTFFLSVTDSLGSTCMDTVKIRFCQYTYSLDDKQVSISQGDSAQLYPGVANGCQPLQYQWSPNYNISDPSIPNPTVWPDTTTFYYLTVTDSAACQSVTDTFKVYVNTLGIAEEKERRIKVYPNPASSFIQVEMEEGEALEFQVYSIHGQQMPKSYQRGVLNLEAYPPGFYLIRFSNGQMQKFIKTTE